jgi:hypothetical protein
MMEGAEDAAIGFLSGVFVNKKRHAALGVLFSL